MIMTIGSTAASIALMNNLSNDNTTGSAFLLPSGMHSLLDGMPNALLMVNSEGTIVLINAQAVKLFGYEREELLGKGIEQLVPKEYQHSHPQLRSSYVHHPTARPMGANRELHGVHKDGHRIPVEIGMNPYQTSEGQFVLASVIDITERKQTAARLKASEERFSLLVNAVKDYAILMLDPQGIVISWNLGAVKIKGYAPEEIIGQSFDCFYVPEDLQRNWPGELMRLAAEKGSVEDEGWRLRKDGSRFWASVDLTAIFNDTGTLVGYAEITRDLTDKRRAEEALRNLNLELEQRVVSRTEELQQSNEHLRESLTRLRNTQAQLVQSERMAAIGGLVAGVAHEINTPVGVSVTATSHLRMVIEKCLNLYQSNELKRSDFEQFLNESEEVLNVVEVNLIRAAGLIRSFKQVAVDQTSEEQRVFKLRHYIEDILLSLKPKLKQLHPIVHCADTLTVLTYPGLISQMFTNLIINSLVHAFEPTQTGTITIEAESDELDLIIRYADNGKGIGPEYLDKIYDPFFTTKRNQGGSGLGLHIIYNLVTQTLGGSINCTSSLGNGVSFLIRIPGCVKV